MTEEAKSWWDCDDLVKGVTDVIKRSREQDRGRENRMMRSIGLYLSRNITSLDSWGYDMGRGDEPDTRLPLVKTTCNTIQAKLVRNLPRSVPITDGASWGVQRQAKALDGFIEGVKYRNGWNRLFGTAIRDAQVMQDAMVWVHSETEGEGKDAVGRIKLERVFPWQMRVDPAEAAYGDPRSGFLELPMDRRVAAGVFREHIDPKKVMEQATRINSGEGAPGYHSKSEQVCVIIGWHLPSYKGADDGREVVIIEGVEDVVYSRPYTLDRFPIARMSWDAPLIGYWGHGLVEDIDGLHTSANEIDEAVRDRINQSFGIVFVTPGSQVSEQLDNDTEIKVFEVEGGDINGMKYHAPNLVPSEHFHERDRLKEWCREFAGVSEMSVASRKPAGLNSGKALDTHQDIESERFTTIGEAMEDFDHDVSTLIIEVATQLHKRGLPIEVSRTRRRRRRSVIERIKWADIKLGPDAYELKVFPASQLPRQISHRVNLVEQLIAAGVFEKHDAMRLMDFPDVDAVINESLAPYYLILDMIEDMIEDKRKHSPIPELDLELTAKVVNMAILQAKIDRVDDDRIAMLRVFAGEVMMLQQRMNPPQPMPAAPMAGGNPDPMTAGPQPGAEFLPNNAGALPPGLATQAAPVGQPVL